MNSIAAKIADAWVEERWLALGSEGGMFISRPRASTFSGGYRLVSRVNDRRWARRAGDSTIIRIVHLLTRDGGRVSLAPQNLQFEVSGRGDLATYQTIPRSVTVEGIAITYEEALRFASEALVNGAEASSYEAAEEDHDEGVDQASNVAMIEGVFRRAGEVLTDGTLEIPVQRPQGRAQWRQYPKEVSKLRGQIKPEQWSTFIRNLEGQRWDDIRHFIPKLSQGVITDWSFLAPSDEDEQVKGREGEHSVARQATLDEAIDRLAQTEDYSIPEDGGELVFGGRAVKILDYKSVRFYLVEGKSEGGSPLYGVGLYIFTDQRVAVMFARQKISSSEARSHTITKRRINHYGDWEERMTRAIQAYVRNVSGK